MSAESRAELEVLAPRRVIGWTMFSLAAGSVNGAAFMACRSFVTHVTGTVTNLGVHGGEPTLATEYGLVFGSFIAGAMLSVVVYETLPQQRRQLAMLPLVLVFLVLVGVAVGGHAGAFGPFGATSAETRGAFALLVLLAGAMGAQNAAVALATNNMVRTTHLTGPTTDFATNLVRAALGRGMGTTRETRWALLRAVKIAAFALGALVAARSATALEFHVFTIPALFVIVGVGFSFSPQEAPAVSSSEEAAPSRDGNS